MQVKIKKYEIIDLGIIEVPTKGFNEATGKLVDGTPRKRHAYKVLNPKGGSCVVFKEDLERLELSLNSVEIIDEEEGDVVGKSSPLIETKIKTKRTVRRK